MFLSKEHSKEVTSDYPRKCTFNESDWHILAGFWHPVALTSEIQDKPFSTKLLDVNLVLWLTSEGLSVAKDMCMHRGSRISKGWIEDDQIVCPMHGLAFAADGMCQKIPSMATNDRIPDKLRLQTYQLEERYGLIWVCLKEKAINPIPEWKDMDNSEYTRVDIPYGDWASSASRHVENFNDVAHHPFMHRKTFGNPNKTIMDEHQVENTGTGLRMPIRMVEMEYGYHDPANKGTERPCQYIYDLTFPFASDLYTEDEDGIKAHFFDIPSPRSANESRIFQIDLVNELNCSKEEYVEYQVITNEEDREIVEGQCPEDLPLDLREEIHLPADRFSLAYRKAMIDFGLGNEVLD